MLFERILTNDDLLPQKTKYLISSCLNAIILILYFKLLSEIWSEFLKFECSVGDLASILKVDRKRQKLNDSVIKKN